MQKLLKFIVTVSLADVTGPEVEKNSNNALISDKGFLTFLSPYIVPFGQTWVWFYVYFVLWYL